MPGENELTSDGVLVGGDFEVGVETTRDVIGDSTGLEAALDAGAHLLSAQGAHQSPAGVRDALQMDDRLHLVQVPEAGLVHPQHTRHMAPAFPVHGWLHRPSPVGAEETPGLDSQVARLAQPVSFGDVEYSIAALYQTIKLQWIPDIRNPLLRNTRL